MNNKFALNSCLFSGLIKDIKKVDFFAVGYFLNYYLKIFVRPM